LSIDESVLFAGTDESWRAEVAFEITGPLWSLVCKFDGPEADGGVVDSVALFCGIEEPVSGSTAVPDVLCESVNEKAHWAVQPSPTAPGEPDGLTKPAPSNLICRIAFAALIPCFFKPAIEYEVSA
jgi:hypothetical protein